MLFQNILCLQNRSKADVSSIISIERLKLDSCEFTNTLEAIEKRQKLGIENPEENLNAISFRNFESIISSQLYINAFKEVVRKPNLMMIRQNYY